MHRWVRGAAAASVWLGCIRAVAGQASSDSSVVVRGIVIRDTGAVWRLFLPTPVRVGAVGVHFVRVTGDTRNLARNENRYVELVGVWGPSDPGSASGTAAMVLRGVKALSPPGETHLSVQQTFTQRAEISVAMVPNRFAYRDSTGHPTGIVPVLTFAIANQSSAPIDIQFANTDVICARISHSREGEPVWAQGWPVGRYGMDFTVNLGATVREAVTLPDSIALPPGHYWLWMGMCALSNFSGSAEFDVTGP